MGNYIFNEFELAVRRMADTDDGKVILRHLKKYKIDNRQSPDFNGDGIAVALGMAFKDGEASTVRELIRIIERDETK
jgi:hypothetical protein